MRLVRSVSLVSLIGTAASTSLRSLASLPQTSAVAAWSGSVRRATAVHRAQLQHVCMQATGAPAAMAEQQIAPAKGGYDHTTIEPKWQDYWDEHDTFATLRREGKEKKYVLDMFPYPSGAGLHVGHPEGYTASDIMARYWRMCDYDVLHPMGWDAFGLPAEQHAINTGTRPEETTKANIANFKRQLRSLGFSYDWKRELATTDIGYVKWTQWIFLQLYKKDLAVQSEVRVNWCAELGTVLANEEVIDGKSERGGFPVMRMPLRQWVLRITEYAEQLAADLATEGIEWPEGTMTMQKTWIGRSEGAEITFEVEGASASAPQTIDVFTTRPDTLMGATYAVIAPEHPLAAAQLAAADMGDADDATAAALRAYVKAAAGRSDLDRSTAKVKSGVWSGLHVKHPLTGKPLPLWVADYVLAGYGTGAVMAVPAHDERDFEFAKAFSLPIVQVVAPSAGAPPLDFSAEGAAAYAEHGVCVNSGEGLDGLSTLDAKTAMIAKLTTLGKGKGKITYKLRDWVFSRQRYWGEPIPIYFPVTREVTLVRAIRTRSITTRPSPCRNLSCPWRCRILRISSRDQTRRVCLPRRKLPTGATSRRRASGMRARRTRCRSGLARAGTTCASLTLRTALRRGRPRPRRRGYRSICTWAAPNTLCCTFSTRASGTRCSLMACVIRPVTH